MTYFVYFLRQKLTVCLKLHFQISKWVDDETTFCLMNLILLFNSSDIRNNLEAPDEVEKHQIYYTELLYRYLLSKYPQTKARSKLAEGICIV